MSRPPEPRRTSPPVDPHAAGQRADRFVRRWRADLPFARIQRLFRERRITVDGRPLAAADRVVAGDRLTIEDDHDGDRAVQPWDGLVLSRLWEDEHVLAIDKPADLVVQPGPRHRSRTLVHALAHSDPDIVDGLAHLDHGLAHRLDRGTSGVMLVGKHRDALDELRTAFRDRRVEKRYLALVVGAPRPDWRIDAPLSRQRRRGRLVVEVAAGGRGEPATTDFERLAAAEGRALVQARPTTGRTHQIRVHLAASRCPILGDPDYGRAADNERAAHELGLHRMFLHAAEITFPHPVDGRRVVVRSPLPADLAAPLARAGLDDA